MEGPGSGSSFEEIPGCSPCAELRLLRTSAPLSSSCCSQRPTSAQPEPYRGGAPPAQPDPPAPDPCPITLRPRHESRLRSGQGPWARAVESLSNPRPQTHPKLSEQAPHLPGLPGSQEQNWTQMALELSLVPSTVQLVLESFFLLGEFAPLGPSPLSSGPED